MQKNSFVVPQLVEKRDGKVTIFDESKIKNAITKAFNSTKGSIDYNIVDSILHSVISKINDEIPKVEDIQNIVEETLIEFGLFDVAKNYIIYRDDHRKIRDLKVDLMDVFKSITFDKAKESDNKRENANIDANTAMGTMLKYGSESSKYFVDNCILPKDISEAHKNGDIHIHDKDFYMLTQTCCQINLKKLFKGGFSTGHGTLREPNSIGSYAALCCIAIQSNQNEMHGGQGIPDFDYAMEDGVNKSYKKIIQSQLMEIIYRLNKELIVDDIKANNIIDKITSGIEFNLDNHTEIIKILKKTLINEIKSNREFYSVSNKDSNKDLDNESQDLTKEKNENHIIECNINEEFEILDKLTKVKLRKEVYQAMQALIHNLNTMNSRAGAQVPFSSLNYGTCTSSSGRLVIEELLRATRDGLGNGETPIFPVQIFKLKEGVNYNKEDKNFDLFKLAIKTSAKRLYPNFSFLDASFNKEYYKEGKPETEVSYMGCRTRVMGNTYKKENEVTYGRGNLSFTSINLPRLGILSKGDINKFYKLLDEKLELVKEQLLHRFKIQCNKYKINYPFLMGEGVWIDSDKLKNDEKIEEILKNGTLSIGFIGLAETLVALIGTHHGETKEALELGYEIVNHMREFANRQSQIYNLNFSLIATPAEGLSGRFLNIDKEVFGIIDGVTDRDYYTNSFHIPVYYDISIKNKIEIEGRFHKLTNGGHISYVEVDGDISNNEMAFMNIIKLMHDYDIGYGSINHPIDFDPVCGYNGIINDVCPLCKRKESELEPFSRIRRITGYLVGSLDRFNNAKRSEVNDRVKHKFI